jgi:hypothetical protein
MAIGKRDSLGTLRVSMSCLEEEKFKFPWFLLGSEI